MAESMLVGRDAFNDSEVRDRLADGRRTEIVPAEGEIDLEDLIAEEEMVISITRGGYVKRLLVVTSNGFGKRTEVSDYPSKGRPTKGVRTIKLSDRKGELVAARQVREGQGLLLVSEQGQVIRIEVATVKRMGRATEGVTLMNLPADDRVSRVAPVEEAEDDGVDAAAAPLPDGRPPPEVVPEG
jgi:DNA gyrase subunit A